MSIRERFLTEEERRAIQCAIDSHVKCVAYLRAALDNDAAEASAALIGKSPSCASSEKVH